MRFFQFLLRSGNPSLYAAGVFQPSGVPGESQLVKRKKEKKKKKEKEKKEKKKKKREKERKKRKERKKTENSSRSLVLVIWSIFKMSVLVVFLKEFQY